MISDYITHQLGRAEYKSLTDGSIFAEIPRLPGVWANAPTVEACRGELREVLEDWLVLKLRDREPIPGFKVSRRRSAPLTHA